MITANRKNWIGLLVLVAYLIVGIIWAAPKVSANETEESVHFEDPALKAAVEKALDIPDPTPTDMRSLTSLIASGMAIVDLAGLEHATSLEKLYLDRNHLTDISTLGNIKSLYFLDLNDNQISNFSSLVQLGNLASGQLSYYFRV